MWKRTLFLLLVTLFCTGTSHAQALFDITNPGDTILGVPNDGDWPGNEAPPLAIDNQISGFKYLHFKGDFDPDPGTGGTGFRVTPSGPSVVITALNFATANDATPRDPISFRLSGSDVSIDGPYILITEGTIDEMSQATPHPRNTWISEPVPITNNKVYTHYELIFTDIRDRAAANSMQIGEVELLSDGSLPGAASSPNPAKEEIDVLRDVVLTWDAGTFAATRNVYLSTNFNDVNEGAAGALIADGITEASVDPGRLPFGETFYWRVDEVNSAPDFTVFTGEVWSFTVEPIGFPIVNITATASSSFGESGPERTIDGSGMVGDLHGVSASDMWISGGVPATIEYAFDRAYKLHELWIWNSNQLIEAFVGFGAKDVVIEHSLDGENWTVLDGVGPLAQAPGTEGYAHNNTIAFGGITAQYARIIINSVQGIAPQVSLSEVRFLFIPTFATRPNPDSGATNVAPDSSLSWGRNGREADRHEVYVGADPDNLALAGGVSESSFDTLALDLQLGQSYAWRVDEVNEAMDPSTWQGTVWGFTTADTIVIDDMESYKDKEFLEIWATWADGFDDPANGSLAGGTAGIPETGIINGGSQSLPLDFDNSAASVSEVTRTFDAPMDWTRHGVASLSLYFRGSSENSGGQLYVKINNTKIPYDGDAGDLGRSIWQPWNIDLSTAGGNLMNVSSLTIGVEGAGATGVVYIDDIRLYPLAPQFTVPAEPDAANLVARYTFDGNANDTSGNGHNGTSVGAVTFVNDPVRGQVVSLPGGDDQYISIEGVGISGNMPRTIACWAKADSTTIPDWTLIFGFTGTAAGGGGSGSHFNIGSLGGPGGVGAHVWGWEETIFSDEAALEWHHYAMTYDGTTIGYYGDGVPMDSDVGKSNVRDLSASSDRVHVGSRVTQVSSFPGSVDDAVIYSVALTDGEIAWLAGRTAPMHKGF
ncbi:MAG: hypothetical protein IIC50_20915 [Planctomycetes bacterium]|nr:hypothetical protein [Planctomycetota bacterium]